MVGLRLDLARSSSVALLVLLFSLRIACRSRLVSEPSLEIALIVERSMVSMPEGATTISSLIYHVQGDV